MPKALSPLYNHSTRNATARQLNISSSAPSRSSWSTSQVAPPPPASAPEPAPEPEHYVEDIDMDIDEDPLVVDPDRDGCQPSIIEVMPGVHVQPTKVKAKRYLNSVRVLSIIFQAVTYSCHH